jgi:polysaccharide biosynthesis protein PslA
MNINVASFDATVAASTAAPVSTPSKASIRLRLYVLALACDVLIIGLSFAIANFLRFDHVGNRVGATMFLAIAPLYVVIAASSNVYSSLAIRRWRQTAWRSFTAFLKAITTILFVAFFLKTSSDLSRLNFAIGCLSCLIFLPVARYVFWRAASRIFNGSPFHTICITDGVPANCAPTVQHIDAVTVGMAPNMRDPHALDRIGSALKLADRVVVYCTPDRRAAWAHVLKGTDLRAEIVVPELGGLGSLGAGTYHDMPTLAVAIPTLDVRSRILKRSLDLAIAGAALLALAPLMLLTALAIRLDSGGPILFVQPRLGRGNRLFPMYKFRSMRSDACDVAGARSTGRTDDRITRVGRIIRATSVDELPQLLNVITGDMSIVGPRPHALGSLAGDKLFWEVDQRYWHRHATKPGITGLAQVRGFRGATHEQSDLVGRLQSDLEYLNGWSIWRDISIIIGTFRVLVHNNAY